jgi:hypothetical protein
VKLSIGLIALVAVFSMTIPTYAYGQSQIAALPPAVGPTTTSSSPSTMPTAQCIDFNSDGVCEYVLLANGTLISNPLLYVKQGQSVNPLVHQQQHPINPMTQLVERQKIIIQQEKARADDNDDNDNDDDHRGDPDCWYGNLFVCDKNGDCDSDRFDCITDCPDGSSVTTGEDCPDEDDDSDEPADDTDDSDNGNYEDDGYIDDDGDGIDDDVEEVQEEDDGYIDDDGDGIDDDVEAEEE